MPWGATAVGGADFSPQDGIPDKYQYIIPPDERSYRQIQYNPFTSRITVDDFDGDGILNQYEARNTTSPWWSCTEWDSTGRYKTNPYLIDSDFDGLSDGWEVDVARDGLVDAGGTIIIPAGQVRPDKPDLCVEVDWEPDCLPWHDADVAPYIGEVISNKIIVAGLGVEICALGALVWSTHKLASFLLLSFGAIVIILAWFIGPLNTIDQTARYFDSSGITFHFLPGEEVPVLTRQHTYPFATYCVYTNRIGYPAGGKTDIIPDDAQFQLTPNGTRQDGIGCSVARDVRIFMGGDDHSFGHEIFHCLGVIRFIPGTDDEDYGGYSWLHYMSKIYLPSLGYSIGASEWALADLTRKVATPRWWG